MIRVLVAEDHQLMREGLKALFAQDSHIEIIDDVDNGSDAVRVALERGPDLVLMDISLPELNGVEATRKICAERPDIHVLVLTMHDDVATVDRALRAGAKGFVIKGSGVEVLQEAIETVYRGEVYLHPSISHFVLQGYLQSDEVGYIEQTLTQREREILQLIAEGHTSKEIAQSLGLKVKTVQNYRTTIMDKLQEQTTAGLVRYAIRVGLVQA